MILLNSAHHYTCTGVAFRRFSGAGKRVIHMTVGNGLVWIMERP
jgi:surface antigen